MKKLNLLFMVCCTMALLVFAAAASAQPQAICVPWQPSNQTIAHYTYSGAEITVKGIVRDGATQYRWDFGDDNSTAWTSITDSYNLGVKHVYNGGVGQLFIATLYVRDGSGNQAQDEYRVEIHESSDLSDPDHLDVRINMSIDEGLWYLHTTMIRNSYGTGTPGYGQPYGFWSDTYPVGAVGTAVDAFQLHDSKANKDYDSDPYVETVQRALNYLLYNTHSFAIGVQSAGDPDVNGNGIGLVTNQSASATDYRQTYVGGICMVALASSGAPNRVAAVGGADVYGRTYADIVQDMVDFFAWGQCDSGWGQGGWRYYANYGSDMSTTQWPPLGMLAAEQNMGSIVPQFVRDELILYLNAAQNTAMNIDNGGFAYETTIRTTWYNITKAAAGIISHEFLGTPLTDPKVESAIGFIYRHWNDTGGSWDHTKLHGNSYGMYGLMKAFRIPEPDLGYNDVTGHSEVTEYDYNAGSQTGNTFEWYYTPSGQANEGLASYIVSTQQTDGSWDDTVGSNRVYDAFCSGWRILVLLKGVAIIPPEAVICDCDEQEYNLNQDIHLDGSCSFHPDLTKTIVLYEWDLDNDGVYDTTGVEATIAGGFPVEGHYAVSLRVTDDNPNNLGGPQTDTCVCNIWVHPPPHCPHAFADGPYIGWIGTPVTLDASTSWDPDNEIANYEWDLDNDGLFGDEDNNCFGESSDAVGINPEWTWHAPYLGVIGLMVTDAVGEFDSCSDVDYSTVEIGNHAPVSDPNGPYVASADSCVTLDGNGSYDPDLGDAITYAWDFNNDGVFNNSSEAQPEFCVGSVIGTMYSICLKVTDNYGEYGTDCTTVVVSPNLPPIADPNGPYLGPLEICFDGTGSDDPDSDPLTYNWDFGDENTGTGAEPCYTYAEAGIYDVCLTVNDGTVDSEEVCTSAVVYDPSAGFVTGGGWIDSPEGAYKPDMSLTGKANFGFVSKYKKGATAPTGQTEFQFQTASLNFHSDSYEWLVVTGANFAKFKGDGTINGENDANGNAYKFMIWAGDDTPDTFRIKIWSEDDEGNETDVYDNGFDQEISGGQIVIHVKN